MDDAYATDEDTALNVAAPGVLTNDTDVDGDTLTAVLVVGPTNGTLTLSNDGSFIYTPNAGFNGSDSFTYRASDGTLLSNIATVTPQRRCGQRCAGRCQRRVHDRRGHCAQHRRSGRADQRHRHRW
ncbi:MAG: cadherin-like domain-containing protein [Chloroflexi bacterium]|nr:cadherin-like domain-containing protein [Chloroflexota bacterium]